MFKSPFLAIQSSFWPILVSFSLFSLLRNVVIWINTHIFIEFLLFSFFNLVLLAFLWWLDLGRERLIGYHTFKIELRLRCAMLLFILSEIFFFVSFFWAFYDAALAPVAEVGLMWPPKGIAPLSVYSVPLLNTVILLTRGVSVTWAHHSIINNLFRKSVFSLFLTVVLGSYFLIMQYVEYVEAAFRISDGVYGRTFFIATGFHGFHVMVGTIFLFYILILLLQGKLVYNHHFSFEAAAWYWHFVDVVWLFLFVSIYWWGTL